MARGRRGFLSFPVAPLCLAIHIDVAPVFPSVRVRCAAYINWRGALASVTAIERHRLCCWRRERKGETRRELRCLGARSVGSTPSSFGVRGPTFMDRWLLGRACKRCAPRPFIYPSRRHRSRHPDSPFLSSLEPSRRAATLVARDQCMRFSFFYARCTARQRVSSQLRAALTQQRMCVPYSARLLDLRVKKKCHSKDALILVGHCWYGCSLGLLHRHFALACPDRAASLTPVFTLISALNVAGCALQCHSRFPAPLPFFR